MSSLRKKRRNNTFVATRLVRDPESMDFVGTMRDNRVPQQCIVDMISNMHDGP